MGVSAKNQVWIVLGQINGVKVSNSVGLRAKLRKRGRYGLDQFKNSPWLQNWVAEMQSRIFGIILHPIII